MAVRKLRYEGDAILRKKCREVEKVDDRINQILDDMMDTLHELGNGAAPVSYTHLLWLLHWKTRQS